MQFLKCAYLNLWRVKRILYLLEAVNYSEMSAEQKRYWNFVRGTVAAYAARRANHSKMPAETPLRAEFPRDVTAGGQSRTMERKREGYGV